jgi:hypothetical protein
MPRPKSEALEIDRRRARVAALYLQGRYQWDIAAELEVDPSTVSRDLKAIRAAWKASAVRDFDEAKGRELDRIDLLERTYWQAWLDSREEHQTTTPAFLAGVQWCIDRRCKLLGLDAPTKVAPTDPSGQKEYGGGLSDADRAAALAALYKRMAGVGAGAGGPPADGAAGPNGSLPG